MKYVKMLGLAAVAAMAMMAFAGAGTASAATLCTNEACTTHLNKGEELVASLKSETSANLSSTGGTTLNTCTASEVKGKTTTTGGAGEDVEGEVTHLTFSSCTYTTDVLELGSLKVVGSSGTTSAAKFRVKLTNTLLGTCTYTAGESTHLGTLTSGTGAANATLDIDAIVTRVAGESGAFCPASGRWIATYVVTSPKVYEVK